MSILEVVEQVIGTISNTVWPVFLPLVMIVGLFLIIRTFTVIQPQTSKPAKVMKQTPKADVVTMDEAMPSAQAVPVEEGKTIYTA